MTRTKGVMVLVREHVGFLHAISPGRNAGRAYEWSRELG